MIESSRFDNHLAWFVGESDLGHYYDQSTGGYLGSWSRTAGQFSDPALDNQNLFDLPVWLDHERRRRSLSSRAQDIVANIRNMVASPIENPLHLQGPYVAVVGDSFGAHISSKHYNQWRLAGHDMAFRSGSDSPAWPSLVADQMELNLAPYGFGGRSWWWSWQKFWHDWHHGIRRLDAMIFLHTGCDRINNSIDPALPHLINMPLQQLQSHPVDRVQAMQSHFLHVHDYPFQRWAQQQFFRYLRDTLPPMKIFHFFCMTTPTPATCDLLDGMIFRMPLLVLSIAEHEDPASMQGIVDRRSNHFNDHNNQVLADLICSGIANYRPGVYDIPWKEFYQHRPKTFRKQLADLLLKHGGEI